MSLSGYFLSWSLQSVKTKNPFLSPRTAGNAPQFLVRTEFRTSGGQLVDLQAVHSLVSFKIEAYKIGDQAHL